MCNGHLLEQIPQEVNTIRNFSIKSESSDFLLTMILSEFVLKVDLHLRTDIVTKAFTVQNIYCCTIVLKKNSGDVQD